MIDLSSLFEFSRQHCVAICSFLVPAIVVATLLTLVYTVLSRPQKQINLTALIGSGLGAIMYLHVSTWLMVGVVMLPTFILTGLASVCLGINGWAIASSGSLRRMLFGLWQWAVKRRSLAKS